jgi:hydroxypyruvate isomerase
MYMERRIFIRQGLSMTGALSVGGSVAAFQNSREGNPKVPPPPRFKLHYAPHFGMFENSAGKDVVDQLKFMADNGFTALEDNGMMGRPVAEQERIAKEMTRLGMKMGVFVVGFDNWPPQTTLTSGKSEWLDKFLSACRTAVDVARRLNAKWMTVVPGNFERNLPMGIQTAHVIEALRRATEIFEPHGLVMVLEPLSDTPDLFLRYSDQTYMICKAVNSPSCKILFDIYHMQRNEGHIIPHIDWAWEEIAYFQIGDNPGRNEPTTGEINYQKICEHVSRKAKASNQTFIWGMEHGNARPGKEGEQALIAAYRQVDSFSL